MIGFAQERERATIGTGRRLDHVRHEAFVGEIIAIAQILAAAALFRFAIGTEFHLQRSRGGIELAFHVAAQIEVAAMGDAFEFAELTGRQEAEMRIQYRSCRTSSGLVHRHDARAAATARSPSRDRCTTSCGDHAST